MVRKLHRDEGGERFQIEKEVRCTKRCDGVGVVQVHGVHVHAAWRLEEEHQASPSGALHLVLVFG